MAVAAHTPPMEIAVPAVLERFPRHRRRLEAACRAAMDDPEVLGMTLGGSFVEGEPDQVSDLDLRVVVEDEALDSMLARRGDLAERAGPLVAAFHGGHVGDERLLITLYDDLVHVDYAIIPISEVAAHNHGRAAHVLWERDRRVSEQLPGEPADDTAADLAWMEARMWTWVWYTHSKILRGELYEALDALNSLRVWVLFRLTAFTAGLRYKGARFAEELVGEHRADVERTVAGLSREGQLEALRATVRVYLALADPLLERFGVATETAAREAVRAVLDRGLDWEPPSEGAPGGT
jgi:hypothetical protein